MKLHLKKSVVACGLALAAGGAQALTPFEAPEITVYLSGASAPQSFLGAMSSQLFQGVKGVDWFEYFDDAGSPTTFNSTDGANYRAYFGTLKTTAQDPNMPSSIAGKKTLIVNRAKGGSVWGVNPVARNQAIAYMPISATNCVASSIQGTFTPGYHYACGQVGNDLDFANVNNVIPDFGVSDVEPKMFKDDRNVEFGQTQLSDSELANITNFGVSALMFGAAATTNVTSVISTIPAAMFGGVLSGTITNWTKVNPALTGEAMVCRRVQGSGTQASYNQFFNNFPCGVNAVGGNGAVETKRVFDSVGFGVGSLGTGDGSSQANAIGIDASSGYTVIENSTSGNVRSCLSNAKAGTDFFLTGDDGLIYRVHFGGNTPTANPLLFTGGAQRKAIGNLSLDSKGGSGNPADWDFLSLNGVAPTQTNLINLSYPFAYELSMQYRTGDLNPLPAGTKKTLIDEFIKRSGDPAILAQISNVNTRDAVAAVPINYTVGSHAKVMGGTRFGNSCQPIQPR